MQQRGSTLALQCLGRCSAWAAAVPAPPQYPRRRSTRSPTHTLFHPPLPFFSPPPPRRGGRGVPQMCLGLFLELKHSLHQKLSQSRRSRKSTRNPARKRELQKYKFFFRFLVLRVKLAGAKAQALTRSGRSSRRSALAFLPASYPGNSASPCFQWL